MIGRSGRVAAHLRAPVRRCFSTASAAGVAVASGAAPGASSSSLAVALKAGPRYQRAPGAAAALKHWLLQANDTRSALSLVREAELRGATLATSIDKEHVYVSAHFARDDAPFFVQLLGDALKPKLYTWEWSEHVVPALSAESAAAAHSPLLTALEHLTLAAYHGKGPGQSLVADPSAPLEYEIARRYVESILTSDQVAVAGAGIDSLPELVSGAFALPSGYAQADQPVVYHGGEARVPAAHAAEFILAFDATGVPEATLAVLRHLVGARTAADAFVLPYKGAALFGLRVPGATGEKAAQATAALKAIADGQVNDLAKAITQAKLSTALAYEGADATTLVAARLLQGESTSIADQISATANVGPDHIAEAARKLLATTPTTVAVGNVAKLPYAEDLL